MTCYTQPDRTPAKIADQKSALARLETALAAGTVTAIIGRNGGIAFKGWTDRADITDLCAYRALTASNSPALRRAIARGEAMAGRKLDARTVTAGVHSHDGGSTWGSHSH